MRFLGFFAAVVAFVALSSSANARECATNTDHACWVTGGAQSVHNSIINANAVTVTTGVVCSLLSGGCSSTACNYQDVLCEKPIGSTNRTPIGQPHNAVKIKSIALANAGLAILGPITLYALGTDNWLYAANADSHFVQATDFFPNNFSALGPPLDTHGNPLILNEVTAYRAIDGSTGAYVVAVSSTQQVYRLVYPSGAIPRWEFYGTGIELAYGDSRGALALLGTDPNGHGAYMFDRAGSLSIPSFPSNQTLALSSSNFLSVGVTTKPLGLGNVSAYFLSNSSDSNNRIFQSRVVNNVWTQWSPYAINLASAYGTDPLPWSVADAAFFHAYTGGVNEGELFFIGSFQRLYEYVP